MGAATLDKLRQQKRLQLQGVAAAVGTAVMGSLQAQQQQQYERDQDVMPISRQRAQGMSASGGGYAGEDVGSHAATLREQLETLLDRRDTVSEPRRLQTRDQRGPVPTQMTAAEEAKGREAEAVAVRRQQAFHSSIAFPAPRQQAQAAAQSVVAPTVGQFTQAAAQPQAAPTSVQLTQPAETQPQAAPTAVQVTHAAAQPAMAPATAQPAAAPTTAHPAMAPATASQGTGVPIGEGGVGENKALQPGLPESLPAPLPPGAPPMASLTLSLAGGPQRLPDYLRK